MRELEKELKAQHDDSGRKLKEAKDHENATRQGERVQVERLLTLAHVVGGNASLFAMCFKSWSPNSAELVLSL